MSPQYLSPGVYVEEVDKGAKPIEGAGTSVAAFIGFAQKGPVNYPTFIANWGQFVQTFGEFMPGSYLAHAVYGYFHNGGGSCYVSRLPGGGGEAEESRPVAQAALPSGAQPSITTLNVTALEEGEIKVEVSRPVGEDVPEDLFNLKVISSKAEETFENVTFRRGKGARNVVEVVNRESKLIRVAEKESTLSIAERTPAPGTYPLTAAATQAVVVREISPTAIVGSAEERSGVNGLELCDDVTMVVCPDVMAAYQAGAISKEGVKLVQTAMLDHAANMRDRFAILDCLPGQSPQEVKDWIVNEAGYDSKYGAVYYPWIKVANPLGNGEGIFVPPSGHMAGIYARSDTQRGVHKAPANEVVQGCIGLETQITKSEQDSLNPVGINCIRAFPGRGIRVWGARTISSDPSWRYINVRRLFNFVEKSIEVGTQWTVFEPNDPRLWARIRRDVKAFLTRVWRDGALFGNTPDEAFYVKCDEELNTVEVRDAGQVIIEVGMAPVKPAEFVIFRISQWAGASAVAE
ncbi:MAG: phage tail sheath family protein [Chloroflexi bacterium]|nr:MAG: phage tail sheath family protein [Chloroflexota bacterium]RLC96316.1 MAG: phage tail sheath family protein [Chloroflexota bacterium]